MKQDLLCVGGSDSGRGSEGWPEQISQLAPRMRQIAEIVYRNGTVTLREIHEAIGDEVTIYGIRTLLGRMVRRGLIRKRRSGRHAEVLYLPAILTPKVRAAALSRMIGSDFEGSAQAALITAMRLAHNSARAQD